MRYLRYTLSVMLMCLLGYTDIAAQQSSPFRLQAPAQQTININQTFTANDTLNIFGNVGNIYGLSVNMTVTRSSRYFLVRLMLEDTEGKDYLLCESYRETATGNTMTFDGYCEETALMNAVHPRRLKIYVENASVQLNSVNCVTSLSRQFLRGNNMKALQDTLQLHRVQSKVEQINAYNIAHNKLWRAGVTSVSLRPFEEQRRLIGFPAHMSSGGIEYYAGGIFEFGERIDNRMQETRGWYDTICVDNFDWRNRHGQNWMTSVKDQENTAACTAFATVGALEGVANLYYNQHLDLNLSELDAITNGSSPNCVGKLI